MTRITQSALDRSLTDALRGDISHAPMPASLLQVPDAWVRGRRSLRSPGSAAAVGGVVTLAAATTLAVLAFVAAFSDRPPVGSEDQPADAGIPIATLDLEPLVVPVPEGGEPAIGPVIEVARVRAGQSGFNYTVYRAEESIETELGLVCLFVTSPGSEGGGCGAMPGEEGTIGEVFGAGSDTHAYGSSRVHGYSGFVALNVAEVWIETNTGGRAQARLIPLDAADIDAQLFIAYLPGGVDSSAWVAFDADGTEIGRISTSPPPEDLAESPIPTPAAP
jgi:hypothetical protein